MHTRITSELPQLRKSLTDLERREPAAALAPELMLVSVLNQWSRTHRQSDCLEGKVEGHQYIPDGDKVLPSDIYAQAIEEDEHFVRILDGQFRLETGSKGERQ